MAEVTVKQLADTVGTSVDSLLAQMKEAGLSHLKQEEIVSDEDKQALLAFLKNNHGGSAAAPKKITLKRKTVSTLKTSGSSGRKTVNVEVRKKRTYVKRDEATNEPAREVEPEATVDEIEEARIMAQQAAAEKAAEAETVAAQEAEQAAEAEESEVEEQEATVAESPESEVEEAAPSEQPAEVAAVEEDDEDEEEDEDEGELDLETLRLRAVARRKKQEEKEQKALDAAIEKKRLEAQEKAEKEKARKKAASEEKAKTTTEAPKKTTHIRLKEKTADDDQDRKKSRGKVAKSRGKQRTHNIRVNENYEIEERRRHRGKSKLTKTSEQQRHGFAQPVVERVYTVEVSGPMAVKDLADQMKVKVGAVVKALMGMGMMVGINEIIDEDSAELLVTELGHKVVHVSQTLDEDNLLDHLRKKEGTLEARAPVVTVMGHVDHGKTSLLDYIRKTRVASGEAGGITQHIGAYHVETDKGMVTFLDTPGHAAFTAMRARGAQSTDVVILIVAGDDGVKPQTEEAIQHARAAGVPIVVAVNKMDKEGADLERVKNELSAKDVIPEEWGGDVPFVGVSAHTGEGIDDLLDAVLLQAEILELQAPRDVNAQGLVIESRLDKGRGAVTSVLVQKGILRKGDMLLAGSNLGRIRAMFDETGQEVTEAGPSLPVEVLGLDGTPHAGDDFFVVQDERRARDVADARGKAEREVRLARRQSGRLENLFEGMGKEEKKTLAVLLKTDVRGSLEAIQSALLEMGNEEVEVNIVASGVGGLSETDINLALTSGAVVFGFNVRADNAARELVDREGVELRYYSVIYDLLDDVKSSLSGMLSPEMREEIVGTAEVREVFKSPKFGLIAGSMVIEGSIHRNKPIRVLRDDVVIYEGELESLRRFKDDVQEVRNGMECGIGVKNYQDVRPGDKIEVFDVKAIARSL